MQWQILDLMIRGAQSEWGGGGGGWGGVVKVLETKKKSWALRVFFFGKIRSATEMYPSYCDDGNRMGGV